MSERYRGFEIDKNPKPIPDRRFDYDAYRVDGNGEEGLVANLESVEACKDWIDEYWDVQNEINYAKTC